jgi:hypothetical protein
VDQKPDARCTPGAVLESATTDQVCRPRYTAHVRKVSARTKARVFALYGIAVHPPGAYEVDHLIPLELGGSNAIENLWPEPAPGFHHKDKVENFLHREVCAGRMKLADAQEQIARDWTAVYEAMAKK